MLYALKLVVVIVVLAVLIIGLPVIIGTTMSRWFDTTTGACLGLVSMMLIIRSLGKPWKPSKREP